MPLRIPDKAEVHHWRERWTDELADAVAMQLVEGCRDGSAESVRRTLMQLNRSLAEVTRYFLLNRLPHRFHTADPRGLQLATIVDPEQGKVQIEIPALDLRGIPWPRDIDASGCALPLVMLDGAQLDGIHLDGAQLAGVSLLNASLRGASFAGADLREASLAITNATGASFYNARMNGADLRHANLFGADFRGADLSDARLEGGYFRMAMVGASDEPDEVGDEMLDEEALEGPVKVTRFTDATWKLPLRDRFRLHDLWDRCGRSHESLWPWEKMASRWFHTDMMGVDINRADMRKARDLEQFVRDQQRLRQFGQKHPQALRSWMLLTDGGMAWRRFLLAALVTLFGYGGLYWFMSLPLALRWDTWLGAPFLVPPAMIFSRISDWLVGGLLTGGPPLQTLGTPPDNPALSWLYWHWISFDVFANLGFPAAMPVNAFGWFLVVTEQLLGLILIGLLIISLASRLARRWM